MFIRKYNVIILAGGEEEAWCRKYGYTKKAFLPLNGKPMLHRVIEAFYKSSYVDRIVVVGPKELDAFEAMRFVHKRLPDRGSFIQNLFYAALYVKSSIYNWKKNHNGYLISFCDAAFLNTDIINATLENMSRHEGDMTLHYVSKETIAKSPFPEENRSYLPIGGGFYTGTNLYYVRKFSSLVPVMGDIVKLRNYRKQPRKFLEHIGCADKDFPGIEEVLSREMRIKVKIHVSPFAEMGVDVDKPADYELALLHCLKEEPKPQHLDVSRLEEEIMNKKNSTE